MVQYYNIIPAIKLPRDAPHEYTYAHSGDTMLEPNSLVSIPFRKSITHGLTINVTKKPPFKVKTIKSFIQNLPPGFSEFLSAFSKLTFEHPSSLLRLFLIHSKHLPKHFPSPNRVLVKNTTITTHEYRTTNERVKWITAQARKATERRKTLLIMIPNRSEAAAISEHINKQNIPCFLFTGSRPNQTDNQAIQPPYCIISSRIGCLLPTAFDETICDDEPNELYIHNEPSPSYDARTVMALRSSLLHESLTFSGYSLSLAARAQSDFKPTRRPKPKIPVQNHIQWISIPKNQRIPKTPITEKLLETIANESKDVMLVTRTTGYARIVSCSSCGIDLRCPDCEQPFRSIDDYNLRCQRCSTTSAIPPFCPMCSGSTFRYLGYGANRIIEIIRNAMPNQTPFIHSTTYQQFEQCIAERSSQHPYIVIIPLADTFLSSEFDSQEMMYHRLLKLVAQTRPNPIIAQYVSERIPRDFNTLDAFFERERRLRNALALPPKKTLLRIRYYNPRISKKRQLPYEQAYTTLNSIFHVENGNIQGISQKKRGFPFYIFYVRIDNRQLAEVDWKKLPSGFHLQQCR